LRREERGREQSRRTEQLGETAKESQNGLGAVARIRPTSDPTAEITGDAEVKQR
jgi:hypothetical protein